MSAIKEAIHDVAQSHGSWIIGVLFVAGTVATFWGLGLAWGVGFIFLVLVLVLIALFLEVVAGRKHGSSAPHQAQAGQSSDVLAAEDSEVHDEPTRTPPPRVETEPSSEEDVGLGEAEEDETESGENALRSVPELIEEKSVPEIRERTNKWIDEAKDAGDRLYRRTVSQVMLYRAGDVEAPSRLRTIADENSDAYHPQSMLAALLATSGAVEEAADELAARAPSVTSGDDRARMLIDEARHRRTLVQFERGEALCHEALEYAASPFVRALGFEELGRCLRGQDRVLPWLAAWEQALALEPGRTSLRSSLAWEYGEHGLSALAIAHYDVLVQNEQINHNGLNNLAVELERQGLLGTSVARLHDAAEGGSAWAAGNLAHSYAGAGFFDEAEGWIGRGEGMEEKSPRIGSARTFLEGKRVEEQEQLATLDRDAQLFRNFIKRAPHAGIDALPQGEWEVEGKKWTFTVAGTQSTGTREGGGEITIVFESGRLAATYERSPYASARKGYANRDNEDQFTLLLLDQDHYRAELIEAHRQRGA